MERSSLRPVLVFFLCLWAGVSVAQSNGQFRYLFTLAQPVTEEGEKKLTDAIRSFDPGALVRMDAQRSEVDLVTTVAAEQGALQAYLWDLDAVIVDWVAGVPVGARISTPIPIPGFPKYYDTGDPAADDARYGEAKAAWIEAHADEYQEFLKRSR